MVAPETAPLDRLRNVIDDCAGVDEATLATWKERARGALHAVVGPSSQYLERFDRRSSAYEPAEADVARLGAVLVAEAEADAFDESTPAPQVQPRSQHFSVDYLGRLVEAVDEFTAAFESWMDTQVESDMISARGLFPTAWPRENSDSAEVSRRALVVAEAAGAAAKAVPVTGAYVVVQGTGLLDPIANWSHVSQPKALLSPADVRLMAAQIRGRLRGMVLDAETNRSDGLPSFGPVALHQVLWNAAAPYWTAHRYRVAVREAAEILTNHWKTRLDRTDVGATSFWEQSLKPEPPLPGVPRISWPGDLEDATVKSMRGGLQKLAVGLNLTVRNVTTHTELELTEQQALEQLGAYSLLAQLLDQCEILRSHGDGGEA